MNVKYMNQPLDSARTGLIANEPPMSHDHFNFTNIGIHSRSPLLSLRTDSSLFNSSVFCISDLNSVTASSYAHQPHTQ